MMGLQSQMLKTETHDDILTLGHFSAKSLSSANQLFLNELLQLLQTTII